MCLAIIIHGGIDLCMVSHLPSEFSVLKVASYGGP